MTKPSAVRRLWYLLGGRLPMRYREWVFADATGPGWMAWFAVRALLRMLPLSTAITLVLMLGLGGPWQLALACGSLGLIVGMYFAVSYAIESTEYRAVLHDDNRNGRVRQNLEGAATTPAHPGPDPTHHPAHNHPEAGHRHRVHPPLQRPLSQVHLHALPLPHRTTVGNPTAPRNKPARTGRPSRTSATNPATTANGAGSLRRRSPLTQDPTGG